MHVTRAIGSLLGALIFVAMSAPAHATSAAPANSDQGVGIAAATPSISPAAIRTYHTARSDSYGCPTGRACFAVYDPNGPVGLKYKVFELYYCGYYALSNWLHYGSMRNSQTGGAYVVIYGGSHPPYPPDGITKVVNWTPAYGIRPC